MKIFVSKFIKVNKIIKNYILIFIILFFSFSLHAQKHPLDGLVPDEYQQIKAIMNKAKYANEKTLYPLIELIEPEKSIVKNFKTGEQFERRVLVNFKTGNEFKEAVVNLSKKKIEQISNMNRQPMILLTEFLSAMEIALSDSRMITALSKRNLSPDDVFCLPLTAGNFFTKEEKGKRIMKIPCYMNPTGSNFYAKPIEGLVAVVELKTNRVIDVIDEKIVPVPKDPWGYTEDEVKKRTSLRPKMNPATLTQSGKPNYKLKGNQIEWDIWKMRFRIDKRPGLVVSDINVNDNGKWRSVIYQTHLSEVFVPYMDPGEGWYWRTYMDSGEYGFGIFLSPLKAGVDCPSYSTFLPAIVHDDKGNPLEIPDAVCIFERNIGDPAWRHFEVFAQSENNFVPTEGRPETELVVRTASEVGNYDYLIDYRFKQDGQIYIKIGASGLDAVKGVASKSMKDKTAKQDTKYGTLIAPHLVGANHDHFFNFKIDFDIDDTENTLAIRKLVKEENSSPRSMWNLKNVVLKNEMEGRLKFSSFKPKWFMIMNMNREGYLGHRPGWMIHHGNIAYGPYDFENDPAMKRNAYIEYSVWNTLYNPERRYAGGKYAFASDGNDTLATWVKENHNLVNKDIVTWFTAGFHHFPRTEDWPVMSTDWKTVHIMPMNFFSHNPALTIRNPQE